MQPQTLLPLLLEPRFYLDLGFGPRRLDSPCGPDCAKRTANCWRKREGAHESRAQTNADTHTPHSHTHTTSNTHFLPSYPYIPTVPPMTDVRHVIVKR